MMLDNREIWRIAMAQSACDIGCEPEDFEKTEPVVVQSAIGQGARKYYQEPISCNFVSYGGNIVASVKPDVREAAEEYIRRFPFYHCFETPNALWLNERLAPLGHKLCFMAEYFLPDVGRLKRLECPYETKVLHLADFADLYTDEWTNALTADRRDTDVLGVGAYDGETLIGLAACSADCDSMWQIGVDVRPEYRKRGVASALTSQLALEILRRGKVPFYCCAWSNIRSVRNAMTSGFVPAWVELTVKPSQIVDQFNTPPNP